MDYPAKARLANLLDTDGPPGDAVPGVIARLIACDVATTRPQLAAATGLARSTIGTSLESLIRAGVVHEAGPNQRGSRGRPAERLELNPACGTILVIDLTPHHAQMAISDLNQTILVHDRIELDITDGPELALETISASLSRLATTARIAQDSIKVVVMSLPGPVDIRRGRPVRPPIMPGWDEYPVAQSLSDHFGCPALVDNDVNLMALGEARSLPADQSPLLFVKIGTGIGGGFVTADGRLHHGADGAACDIGHLRALGGDEVECSCGNVGCVEALASVTALTRQLQIARDDDSLTKDDLERLLRSGDPTATRLVRTAAASVGQVVAALVHIFNPARIAIGSPLASASDDILAGVRSVVYQAALPLATRNLTLAHSVLGDKAGIIGGIVLGAEHLLSPAGMACLLRGRRPAPMPAAGAP